VPQDQRILRQHATMLFQNAFTTPSNLSHGCRSCIPRSSFIAGMNTGATFLYLAFGFLEWDESIVGRKQATRLAPLSCYPFAWRKKLNPRTATSNYEVVYTGEDILTNLPLREKLRRDFGHCSARITEELLPEEYFARVRETCSRRKLGWKLASLCFPRAIRVRQADDVSGLEPENQTFAGRTVSFSGL